MSQISPSIMRQETLGILCMPVRYIAAIKICVLPQWRHMSGRDLLTEIREGVEQRSTGNLDQTPERLVQIQNHQE